MADEAHVGTAFLAAFAPAQGYHRPECGFHAPWLAEVVRRGEFPLAAIPATLMLPLFSLPPPAHFRDAI